ncbi:MAG TPA: DUF1566 domain-containing protein [Candidatus Binatia bacterium]|nr:DUF1566 domain-containing protein [Candidatus Binatia bacterium]
MRATISTVILCLALVSAAAAAPTAQERCQAAKIDAVRKRAFCTKGELRKDVLGLTPDVAKCDQKFATAITRADTAAARKGASCRWLDNADGTATDLNTGLQWELKTDDASVHDKDNAYSWKTAGGGTTPDGTAFTAFLGTLNAGVTGDGVTTTGCFAGHCDWRLPTVRELGSVLDPGCAVSNPCTTIPGFTQSTFYWSSSSDSSDPSDLAWFVDFSDGYTDVDAKTHASTYYARAVRGGSGT